MDRRRIFYSALEDKDIYNIIGDKKGNNKFLNIPKTIKKFSSFESGKLPEIRKTSSKSFSKYIHNKVRQYQQHPFRQVNLKIVEANIKNKLFEMNLDKEKENEKSLNVKNDTVMKTFKKSSYSLEKFSLRENNLSKNLFFTPNKDKLNSKTTKKLSDSKSSSSEIKVSLLIPDQKKIKKKKKKKTKLTKLKLNENVLVKLRKIKRVKNLYDSLDDDESEEEVEERVINPELKIITIFDFFILSFFVYHFIITTISLSKDQCRCALGTSIGFSDILLFMNDILCILDLMLSFFRGYYNYNYELVLVKKLIIMNYLKGDFFFDLLSAIPIFSISKYVCIHGYYEKQCFKYEMPTRYLLLKLSSFLKITKIKKIFGHKKNQALDRFIELISDNYAVERTFVVFIYALKYIGIFHFLACIHIFIGNHSYSNWLIATNSENESFFNIYIKSVYFILATLTTIGYGDIYCQSFVERIFQILLLSLGSVFYPYVISSLGNLIENDSNIKRKINHNLEMLENIRINYPNISFKLYNKIYDYLLSKGSSLKKYDINSFIESLPFTLKNNILFTMYHTSVTNFKFFKKNNNSVFVAETLNNFVQSIAKKNEFLAYEGEMLQEIIFIKDGIVSLNAAINIEDPMKSINKYFFDSFSPFTTAEEKKIMHENMNNKSNFSLIGDMNFDRVKNKLNNAFKNFRGEKNLGEKSHFEIQTNQTMHNNKNENFYFDVKAGAIINDEGNYQYFKILDIRKNEHFGCVFMTLNKPCPLSLQVKSKITELYLLKKAAAINLSKNYPNIWRKIYAREFHNLRTIKKQTFTILRKYIQTNELCIDENLDSSSKFTNNISSFDINLFDKKNFDDKQMLKNEINQNLNNTNDEELNKNNTLNFEYDNKAKKVNFDLITISKKPNIKKNVIIRTNSSSDQRKTNLYPNTFLNQFSPNKSSFKSKFLHNNFKNNIKLSHPQINKENLIKLQKKRSKLNKLKTFLINYKKNLSNKTVLQPTNSYEIKNNEKNQSISPKSILKKSCLKKGSRCSFKNKFNNLNSLSPVRNSTKSVEFDLNSLNVKETQIKNTIPSPISTNLMKDLDDICAEETNFSFCSIDDEISYKNKILSIERSSNFEISSSYDNLNKLSKGKYIKDINLQNKMKILLINHCKDIFKTNEPFINDTLLLESSSFINKFDNEKRKNKQKENNPNFQSNKEKSSQSKKSDKKRFSSKNKTSKTDFEINNDLDASPIFKAKNQNLSDEQSNEMNDPESIRVNKSVSSSFLRKSEKEDSETISDKNNFGINIKKNINVFNNKEVEYIIDKENNINNKNIDYSIFKNLKRKKTKYKNSKFKYRDKNKDLIHQMLQIEMPNSNMLTNNIVNTSSNMKDNKNDYNSLEKSKNFESISIYNIIQKNVNKNLNIIDNNDKNCSNNYGKSFCCII